MGGWGGGRRAGTLTLACVCAVCAAYVCAVVRDIFQWKVERENATKLLYAVT